MDPRTNPYAPGAGAPPPELAGRDTIIESASIALHRIRSGLVARSLMLIGLRGVGKTVLLNRIRNDAEAEGCATMLLEAPERRSLPALLAPGLRAALLRLDRVAAGGERVRRALRALGGFVQAMKVKYEDIEFGIDLGVEHGVADTGDLDADLSALLQAVGEAARERKTLLAMFVDELQYVAEPQLAALISALHRCAQLQLPVTLIGAGLPQLPGQLGEAKSYAERLFEFVEVGALPNDAARQAIIAPASRAGVAFTAAALDEILRQTGGYPYFLQEWGKHAWDCADASPITIDDVRRASERAIAELDMSFFRVRFDRLAPSEKRYLRAMAELGPGPHRSGDIAQAMGREVQTVAPIRAKLIDKGMIYSPSHGDTSFTVPLFDGYMRRVMPRLE
ncbi:MAG TPA: ATP-binding protein [Burkholderiaceae bacterium]|nr:ATP-binding protein [Burkholderiaceae bacterium]